MSGWDDLPPRGNNSEEQQLEHTPAYVCVAVLVLAVAQLMISLGLTDGKLGSVATVTTIIMMVKLQVGRGITVINVIF